MAAIIVSMRCEGGADHDEEIEVGPQDDARALAVEATEAWVRDGDWGAEGARIDAWFAIDEEEEESIVVDVPADEDALMRAAGADCECRHEWTHEGEGGSEVNPGVWSLGGTTLEIRAHCRRCGLRRVETSLGPQRNHGEADEVRFELPSSDELEAMRAAGLVDEEVA